MAHLHYCYPLKTALHYVQALEVDWMAENCQALAWEWTDATAGLMCQILKHLINLLRINSIIKPSIELRLGCVFNAIQRCSGQVAETTGQQAA